MARHQICNEDEIPVGEKKPFTVGGGGSSGLPSGRRVIRNPEQMYARFLAAQERQDEK